MTEENLLGLNVQVRDEPAEEDCGGDGAQELSDDEPRNIAGPNARESVA